MNVKTDSGLSEVVSMSLILVIVILVIAMLALVALPIMGTNAEREHNGDVFLEFAQMKADIDTVCLSNSTGVTRQAVFTLSPTGDRTEITVIPNLFSAASFGEVTLSYGTTHGGYAEVMITYNSSNMYAEEMKIIYNGTLIQNGRVILPGSSGTGRHIVVVNKTYVPERTIGGAGVATLEYRLEEIVTSGSDKLYVFSMRLQ